MAVVTIQQWRHETRLPAPGVALWPVYSVSQVGSGQKAEGRDHWDESA